MKLAWLTEVEGDSVSLDFTDEESAGTQRLFALAGPWLDIIENGYTVFIDEIETSLHPILVRELLKILLCSKNNINGAQVIFTTHNPILLDTTIVRRDQVSVYRKKRGWRNPTLSSDTISAS